MNAHVSPREEQLIRQQALRRIASLFNVAVDTLDLNARFGTDLKAQPRSFFKENAFDIIDGDIRDVADRALQKKMSNGEYEICTVEDYCTHMVQCFPLRPRIVAKVLDLPNE